MNRRIVTVGLWISVIFGPLAVETLLLAVGLNAELLLFAYAAVALAMIAALYWVTRHRSLRSGLLLLGVLIATLLATPIISLIILLPFPPIG